MQMFFKLFFDKIQNKINVWFEKVLSLFQNIN